MFLLVRLVALSVDYWRRVRQGILIKLRKFVSVRSFVLGIEDLNDLFREVCLKVSSSGAELTRKALNPRLPFASQRRD
jgi:hypothetical protein